MVDFEMGQWKRCLSQIRGNGPQIGRFWKDLGRSLMLVVIMGMMTVPALNTSGQEQLREKPSFARRIRIKLPITGSSDVSIKRIVQQVIEEAPRDGERPIIVFEFWSPNDRTGAGSEFERSLSLARFLTSQSLDRVRTIAFIPKSAIGHAVLVALACEQIIMSEDAVLGDAGDGEKSIGPTMRGGYTEISRSRRTIPEAFALGMLDPELEIFRVTTDSGVLYASKSDLEHIQKERIDLQAIESMIPAGRMGRFRGSELRQLGFVSYLAANPQELAARLNLPADQLEYDPSLGGNWRAIRMDLTGPITAQSVDRIIRSVQQQADIHDANFLCLQIDSPGGASVESMRLANYLSDLDPSQMRTVAYVPREARAAAAIVAIACDHVVTHADAVIGGVGAVAISPEESVDLMDPIGELGRRKSRHWSLLAAMVNPKVDVYRFTRDGRQDAIYLSTEEFEELVDADPSAADWQRGELVTTPDELLQLAGDRAAEFGIVRFIVDNFDQLLQLYQLPESPTVIGPNWAYDLIEALASPQLTALLLFIGGFALISELSSPGIGVGGFIAAVCYMLFFWSNFLHGTAEVLEIMLFVTGLACVLVEIFIIPGFGVFGLGGGALMLASLILATQTFVLPTNDYQMQQLSQSMFTVAMAGAGVFVGAFVIRKYAHRVPVFNKIMLIPPDEEGQQFRQARETVVNHEHLVGLVGVTRTQLTPSGKAVIGDEVVDVITDGELVEKGCQVEVVEAMGNHVVVRQVNDTVS